MFWSLCGRAKTSAQNLVNHREHIKLSLLELYVSSGGIDVVIWLCRLCFVLSFQHQYSTTGCGILSKAVLQRDIIAVKKVLADRPQYLGTETNIFGHSAVHLAIGWPEGLEILLKAADEALLHRDVGNPHALFGRRYSTPLDYAIAFGCTKSIRLLAEANTAFDFEWNLFIGTASLPQDVSNVVLDIIVARLHQLFEFGVQKLRSVTISSLGITSFELFHSKAETLLYYLEEVNIQRPRKFDSRYFPYRFWLGPGGLYHQSIISAETAMAFFNAGFKDIDTEVEGITPIMNLCSPGYRDYYRYNLTRYFRIVEFFVQKGAQLDRQVPLGRNNQISNNEPARCHRAIHRVACYAWKSAIFFDFSYISATVDLGSSQIWRSILQSSTSDPCNCACASGGCRPITLALKYSTQRIQGKWWYIFHTLKVNWEDILSPVYKGASVELLFKLTLLLDALEGDQLADDVIRYLTFSALGMTHTCCKHNQGGINNYTLASRHYVLEEVEPLIHVMDPVEVEEIHEEESTLIEKLDFLHTKFMEDFRKLGVPLSRFILENWRETMLTELSNSEEIPESAREQLNELGVSIYTEPSSNTILTDERPDIYADVRLEWIEPEIIWIQQYFKNDQNQNNDPNEDYKRTVLKNLLKQLQQQKHTFMHWLAFGF
ncbi:hypothetical protein ACMFMF_003592 [Clarireedia jacksonii]